MRLAAAAFAALALAPLAHAGGDAEKGKKVFNKCAACHTVGEGAVNRIGPQLNGIVGGAIADDPDFNYSQPMRDLAAANGTWNEELLAKYLENPKAVVPAGKMAFIGLKKPEEQADVIAYMKTFP